MKSEFTGMSERFKRAPVSLKDLERNIPKVNVDIVGVFMNAIWIA